MLRPYASEEAGAWLLPDIGTQVICCFFNYSPSKPIVIGSVYTPRAKPPLKENPDNNLKVFTTKSGSKIILNDKDGEERISIHTKDGKMRLILDKNKGLEIANEQGDIAIKCRKLVIEGKDDTTITTQKKLAIKCQNDKLTLKARQVLALKSGKDVVLKGQKIKLKGNIGVTAGGKQIATKDDQVMGVDLHDIQVPSSSGLVTVPAIPHIYAGKLADKLSSDVTVNNRAAVPLPIMVPGMDSEQFKKDGRFLVNTRNPVAPAGKPRPQDIQRSLQNPRWSSSKDKVGEEVTLSVDLVNQHTNASVYFAIWKEGAVRQKQQQLN